MEPYHNDDFSLDPFIRFGIVVLLTFEQPINILRTFLRPPLCLLIVLASCAIGLFALYYFSIFESELSDISLGAY